MFLSLFALLALVVTGCGDDAAVPTEPPTTTTTTTTIPTTGRVQGTLLLADRGDPIVTTVDLVRDEGSEIVASTRSDADGAYMLETEIPGTYNLRVSLGVTVDRCDDLRQVASESGDMWPSVIRMYTDGAVTDVLAGSIPVDLDIGDVETMDLSLTCD